MFYFHWIAGTILALAWVSLWCGSVWAGTLDVPSSVYGVSYQRVDVPDTAPPADTTEQGIPGASPQKAQAPPAPIKPPDGGKPAGKPGVGSATGTAQTTSAIPH